MPKPQILLTNDDGIHSPGLWAAAASLSELGFVHVVAPRTQVSGAGRSLPNSSDGLIAIQQVQVKDKSWQVYAVGGTPAQCVLHALLEILPEPPDLLVSGINYGENAGNGVTVSGTVGAALEAASMGVPSLAISLQTAVEHHLSNSDQVDFSAASYFTAYFARHILEMTAGPAAGLPPDVDLLKVEVPAAATPLTPWRLTRVSRRRYWIPTPPVRSSWDEPCQLGYAMADDLHLDDPDSDSYVLRFAGQVTVSPISLDLTSRLNLADFERQLRQQS